MLPIGKFFTVIPWRSANARSRSSSTFS